RIGRRNAPRQSDDEFEPAGLLHRPLVVGPVALGVATLVIVPLVMLGSGGSGGGGETRTARADGVASPSPSAGTGKPAPTVSVSPSMVPPPSASATKPKSKPKSTPPEKNGGAVTVTVTATPPGATTTARPPQDTAATAVNRLAGSDPSGRHICYRAYVSGQGWQRPVCDGTMAGTTGQNKPIKALNIAVTGTGGSDANAFRHDPESTDGQGKWVKQWTGITADGRNNYIGSTKKSAPYMTGFAINIGSGRICQTAKVRGAAWGGQGCADPRPDFVFGGTLENTRWLEAVKFTV
ncbi:hydrogenase expression protein HypA, partial [Streptomyces olivochromogenes]|nr:hydrogenase expression protein HypA [Streptomyces olivochromogenes]